MRKKATSISPPAQALLLSLPALILIVWILVSNQGMPLNVMNSSISKNSTRQASCDERLDDLERTFNQRRDSRNEQMWNLQNLWNLYDLFEPEAVCLSDERFGSEKRYTAFGDGE